MIPPFKFFTVHWTEIEAKLEQLQDEFLEKYNHVWSAKPKDQAPKLRPLSKEKYKRDADKESDIQDL